MTLKIKVCGITNKKELEKIQKLDVDYMGFINVERSKRYISIEKLEDLQKSLNDKDKSVLVIEPENPYEAISKANMTKIRHLQLHSLTCPDVRYILWASQYYCNIKSLDITKVVGLVSNEKISPQKQKEIEHNALFASNILFDYKKDGLTGGTGSKIPLKTVIKACEIVKNKHSNTNVTLSGGLDYDYLSEIKDNLHNFDCIDINSGVEDSPGHKNIKKIKEIIKLIKE